MPLFAALLGFAMQTSELEPRIARFVADQGSLQRAYPVQLSPARTERLKEFYERELADLKKEPFAKLGHDGKIDFLLLQNELRHEIRTLEVEQEYANQTGPLMPFAETIIGLEVARRKMTQVDPAKTAELLDALLKAIREAKKSLESGLEKGEIAITNGVEKPPAKAKTSYSKSTANRALQKLGRLQNHFEDWFRFYNGYDPMFSWWNEAPYKAAKQALDDYSAMIREKFVGIKPDDKTTIIGFPIGRDALLAELEYEMIPYSPDELIEIANKEFAWCDAEMAKATKDLGKKDWKEAMEYVKQQYVEPGKQPALIRELALEAIEFLEKRDLVTIPPLCKETWRMEMMSPEAQLVSPFFLGGEMIQVSFPTNTMSHEAKRMSLRGNNRYFSRATVQHELIPGHHLQGFMLDRHRPYRSLFNTPFWIEGWALYWEMLLWDLGFPKTPEEKIGMLFWRMHRCARIIFSLSFHLSKMTPSECVDFLVERVGHERENALAEVRRSFAGNYGPLYQAAYMLGGLQIMALKRDLVDSKKMGIRDFHDAILEGNLMPIEMVRANLTKQALTPDFKSAWKFYK